MASLCKNPRFLKDYHRVAVKFLSDSIFCRTQNRFGRPWASSGPTRLVWIQTNHKHARTKINTFGKFLCSEKAQTKLFELEEKLANLFNQKQYFFNCTEYLMRNDTPLAFQYSLDWDGYRHYVSLSLSFSQPFFPSLLCELDLGIARFPN